MEPASQPNERSSLDDIPLFGGLRSDGLRLRTVERRDRDRVYEICLRTGASGDDATGLVSDESLFGDLFAGAYVELEPQHGLVLVDPADQALGYVLAAVDSRTFETACDEHWWPSARTRHPKGSGSAPLDELLVAMVHDPPRASDAVVERYPSHLHIDLLPEAQGQGWGRRMIGECWRVLERAGSPGLHLGTGEANTRSHAFYEALGMGLHSADGVTRTYVTAF